MTRHLTLLLGIADDLERGAVPLNGAFLSEHGVTLDECLALTDTMATVLRGYVRAPQRTTLALTAAAVAKDAAEADCLVATVEASHARAQIIKDLGALGGRGQEPAGRPVKRKKTGRQCRTGCAAKLRDLATQPFGASIVTPAQDHASIHASAMQAGIKVRCLTLPSGEMQITRIDPDLSVEERLKTTPVNTGRRTHLNLHMQKLAKKKVGGFITVVPQSHGTIYVLARRFGIKVSCRVVADGSIKITREA